MMLKDHADKFARAALDNIAREFPNATQHVWHDETEGARPRDLHPAFYGSFDWHSCVHMHWLLVHLLRRHESAVPAAEIRCALARSFEPARIVAEARYLKDRPSFERPYGWAWALKLAAELDDWNAGATWARALDPLTQTIIANFRAWLPRMAYPIRNGLHGNTAFALLLSLDYAGDAEFEADLRDAALRWYAADRNCNPDFEPSGFDFLSPALIEAALMRRVLDAPTFSAWRRDFLPDPKRLREPAQVLDIADGHIGHLLGLNFSRAWCLRLAYDDTDAARRLIEASLPYVTGGHFSAEHWLASFATLAMDVL